jgi:hypothetical protein
MRAAVLAVGDGVLGFWRAAREVFAQARTQRCWFRKIANVLGALPESAHPGREEGAGADLERRGQGPRPGRGEGVRGRLQRQVPQSGRMVNAPHLVALARTGATFVNGKARRAARRGRPAQGRLKPPCPAMTSGLRGRLHGQRHETTTLEDPCGKCSRS